MVSNHLLFYCISIYTTRNLFSTVIYYCKSRFKENIKNCIFDEIYFKMNTWISKNIPSIFNNNLFLGQILIVILFFECFYIKFEQKSLVNISLDFKEITLLPFLLLVFIILFTKIIWYIISFVKLFIPIIADEKTTISFNNSYTFFLLLILSSYYLYLIRNNPEFYPFNISNNRLILAFYEAPFIFIMMLSSIAILFRVNFDD